MISFTPEAHLLTVQRKPGDDRVGSESAFWYMIKYWLRTQGYDVIKKEMAKDGHMTSEGRYYVRTRTGLLHNFAIFDDNYMLRSISADYNKGKELTLTVMQGIMKEPKRAPVNRCAVSGCTLCAVNRAKARKLAQGREVVTL